MKNYNDRRLKSDVFALMPARGGFKGRSRKNLQRLAGRPLLVHTVEAALADSSVTRVAVSTDDDIASVAKACGAEVVQRPGRFPGGRASSESALPHGPAHLRATEGYEPELAVFLQLTLPLRVAGALFLSHLALLAHSNPVSAIHHVVLAGPKRGGLFDQFRQEQPAVWDQIHLWCRSWRVFAFEANIRGGE